MKKQELKNKVPNIKVLGNRVLILPVKISDKKTASGIILPESLQEKPLEGVVILIGDGGDDKPMVVKPNDKVYYSKHTGTEVAIDDEDYLILRETDIVFIVNADGSVTPIGDRIVVEIPAEEELKTEILDAGNSKFAIKITEKRKSGLVLLDTNQPKEREPKGKIIAMGGGLNGKKLPVNIGDEIFFGKFAGTDLKIKDKNCKIIRQSDIILILTGEAKIDDKTSVESQL